MIRAMQDRMDIKKGNRFVCFLFRHHCFKSTCKFVEPIVVAAYRGVREARAQGNFPAGKYSGAGNAIGE
jgi:hypothetical protein